MAHGFAIRKDVVLDFNRRWHSQPFLAAVLREELSSRRLIAYAIVVRPGQAIDRTLSVPRFPLDSWGNWQGRQPISPGLACKVPTSSPRHHDGQRELHPPALHQA